MSQSPATRQRPISPHLTVYKFTPTMTMSILHRITGGALYFGTLLVAWWLIAAAISPDYFDFVSWIFGSWIGLAVLFGYTWALTHHMLGGIRHFVWDVGAGLEKHVATKLALANLAGSVILTVLVWAAAYWARGSI